MDASRQMLRHTLSTLAYRCAKTLRDAPCAFADFRACEGARTPHEILAHLSDLLDWGLSTAQGTPQWRSSKLLPWQEDTARFFAALQAFDDYLASRLPLRESAEKLFQGPIADALTHVGQLALLRRMAGAPIRGENYFIAEITAGRVSQNQPPPRAEFD